MSPLVKLRRIVTSTRPGRMNVARLDSSCSR
jgi:hypothetical protein